MDTLHVFLPIDRFHALAHNSRLPDHAHGAVLFADVPGFTPLTESMAQVFGPQRGAEELTYQLNRVYTALIDPVHRYHGSVISFSGDSVNCWFDGDDGGRAGAAGLEMQAAVARLDSFTAPGGLSFQPSIKVAIAVGPVRRFLAGDPAVQRMDVLTGSALEVLDRVGHLVESGKVLIEASAAAQLAAGEACFIFAGEREDPQSDIHAAVLIGQPHPIPPNPWPELDGQAADKLQPNASILDPASDIFRSADSWLLPAVQQRLQTGAERFLADLRPVTVLFLNFGGLDYNDDEAELLLDAYLRKVQNCLVRYEGAPLQLNTGDKGNYLYAAFGAPLAHDDDAARAVTAALELLQISTEMGFVTGARVGIAQGILYAGAYGSPSRQTYGLIGDKVNVAARLMQLAKPGEVLCDQEVYAQARRYWSFETLAPVHLKGKAAAIPVFRPLVRIPTVVVRAVEPFSSAAPAGRLAPLVGREPEIGRLQGLLDALQDKKSGVLFIEGEAGIGKSRLIAALLEMANERGLAALLGSGQSIEQNVPYRAWRDIFQTFFDIHEPDSLATRQEKVRKAVEAAVPRMLQRLPLLNEVLNLGLPENQLTTILDPKLRRESLFNLLIALLRSRLDSSAGTQTGPIVLILDDAHWMDVLSWELALNLARVMLLEEKPLLLVLVSRPLEESHPGSQVYELLRGLPTCDGFSLEALDDAALAPLIAYQLGISPDRLPPEIFQFVQTRSDGNPFFAEELIQTMLDRGLITIEPGEHEIICHACPDLAGQALPGTLQGLILARIDRLPPEQQLTIKVAAVIGRTFTYTPLRNTLTQFVSVAGNALKGHLSELVRREMTLLEIPEPELTYIFKHIITQEVAYQSLLYTQRKEIHLAVARWYEALLQADETPEQEILPLLAYQYRQAEHTEREQLYARKAGEAAARAYANDSALAYFTRALELTPSEDLESTYALRKYRLSIYTLQGNLSAALDEINQLAAIADQLSRWHDSERTGSSEGAPGGLEKQAEILLKRSRLLNNQGQYEAAEEFARQAKALAQKMQNTVLQIDSHIELGLAMWRRAQYAEAFQEMEPALEIARASGLRRQEAQLLHQLGITADLSGKIPQSLDYLQQCLSVRRVTGDRQGEAMALNNLGVSYWHQGNLTIAREYLEQSLAIKREIGARSDEVYPIANIAIIFYQQRRHADAVRYGQQALALARELNLPYSEARTQGILGSAYQAIGNFALALSAYEQGLAVAQATGDRQEEVGSLENVACIHILIGDFQAANSYLEKALPLCQEIGDREIEACIERDLATRLLWLGDPDLALAHCERALAIVRQLESIIDKEKYWIIQGEIYLQRNRLDQAAAIYQETQKFFTEIGRPATEAEAGFIRIDLARNDIAQAAGRAAEILASLENDTVADAVDPAAIYLACCQALQAAGDARSTEVLALGYNFLQSRAGWLTDDQRRMYLENIPSNKALLALCLDQPAGRND